ncbi:MAG: hypothetical protein P8X47_02965 [Ignavibacteriaceae bacterium]
MKQNSFEEILRDTKHKSKAKEVFLKLLAKQKSKHKDWSDVRSQTYITNESVPEANPNEII